MSEAIGCRDQKQNTNTHVKRATAAGTCLFEEKHSCVLVLFFGEV